MIRQQGVALSCLRMHLWCGKKDSKLNECNIKAQWIHRMKMGYRFMNTEYPLSSRPYRSVGLVGTHTTGRCPVLFADAPLVRDEGGAFE